MCRSSKIGASPPGTAAGVASSPPLSPRYLVDRPTAPTPEQTNHWLHGMDQLAERSLDGGGGGATAGRGDDRPPKPPGDDDDSPRSDCALPRPRSPTPTKMLAWEEARSGRGDSASGGGAGSAEADSDHEGGGDHTDGHIAQLIGACQLNDINRVFAFYEQLHRMKVPMYEGVYKLIIECCMRTQQLGHAMQFYETLKASGQRISLRLVLVLMEACAKEQHSDKVHTIWKDWCPPTEPVTAAHVEVLLVTVSALIRTMSPDLARDVLSDAAQRSGDRLAGCLADHEIELEDLLQLNETVAEEARVEGTMLEELAGRFDELHSLLEELLRQSVQNSSGRPRPAGSRGEAELLMEDVDLDLELAAM